MAGREQKPPYPGFQGRIGHIALGLVAALAILCVRLWFLQVVYGHAFRDKAEKNRLHPQRLRAPRGIIYGRGGAILADNRPACDLVLVPAQCEDPAAVCQRLEALLGIDGAALLEAIAANDDQPFEQLEVKQDLTRGDLIRVEEHAYALPGVFTVVSPQRRYLHGATGGQILGYMGEVAETEIAARPGQYQLGDWIGRAGIEQQYEARLRGEDGRLFVTRYAWGAPQLRTDVRGNPIVAAKDSYGHELEEEPGRRQDPRMGASITLTLDIDLQAKAEALLEREVGAIVVLDANTGAVLALASTPTYDPSVFVTRGRDKERAALLDADDPKPMMNRAFRETYPPGSVFKVLLACAALEEGLIDEHTTFFCPGYYQIDNKGRRWHCWKRGGHGAVGVVDALAFSCDVFFYNVGRKLGIGDIHAYALDLGLGYRTGLDLPREEPGLIPSQEWKRAYYRQIYPNRPPEWDWRTGDTLNVSIGQGSVLTTPLQCAVLMAAVVNGGYRVRPYLNASLGPKLFGPFVSEKTLAIVRKGMRKCVEKGPPAPTGTGRLAQVPGMAVLGKTGTAQVVALQHHADYEEEEDIPYELRDHAWFVAGVLEQEPPISIAILVEHGAHGSSAAAPLAKAIIEFFYRDRLGPVLALGGAAHDPA